VGAVHPERPSLTGLTGAAHRSDRFRDLVGFPRVNIWVSLLLSRVAAISSLVRFGAWKVRFVLLGLPGFDRSDRHGTPV
jgi:hypothetical protein